MTRILVSDDDAASRAALTCLLTQKGYDVRTAADGSEGLCCMAESLPDVLLVNIYMPEQDGLETLRLVRRAFSQVPIMAMSGGLRATRPVTSLRRRTISGRSTPSRSPLPLRLYWPRCRL